MLPVFLLLGSCKEDSRVSVNITLDGAPDSSEVVVSRLAVNEMRGFLRIFGCESDTIFRYCGIGDLGLTALNDLSRNRTLGMLIGKGFGFDPESKSSTVVEGFRTVKLMGEITREKNVAGEFPLVQALYRLLYENDSLNDYTVSVLN